MTTHEAGPFDGLGRVLFLHAHPDDETLSTGGTIAMLTARGTTVTVLTGTRGERGEVVDGPLKRLEGTPLLAPHRVAELADAMRALGVTDQRFLGGPDARERGLAPRRYVDSGMVWQTPSVAAAAPDAPLDALSRAPLGEVTADIRQVIETVGPDLVVTYDSRGGYGHPDHIRMHVAGLEAAREVGVGVALIEPDDEDAAVADSTGGAGTGAGRAGAAGAGAGGTGADGTGADGAGPDETGLDGHDESLYGERVYRLDVRPWLEAKVAALSAHQSQLTVLGGAYRLSGGQVHTIGTVERFRIGPGPELQW